MAGRWGTLEVRHVNKSTGSLELHRVHLCSCVAPAAAAHLDFNGCVLSDSPARKRRLTLESFATVVQLEVVRWHPRAVAEGLVQESSRQVQ